MARKTPLYEEHVRLGAKMTEFSGWMMPIQYSSIIEEHLAVRTNAGLFDVSHMGEIEFRGPQALDYVNYVSTNNVHNLKDGQAHYSLLLNESGTVIDDIILYRLQQDHFIMVVNASNIEKDYEWLISQTKGEVRITNNSDNYALIALQGPKAATILQGLTDIDLNQLAHFQFAKGSISDQKECIAARTGYTGEDGFELFCPPPSAPFIWQSILEKGKPEGIKPIGLGARDTLRLEMKYSLYGHEISDKINPLEAGLGWAVKLDKPGDFIGKQALLRIKQEGLKRKLVGFKMQDRGIPRSGCSILSDHQKIGFVTSGTMSPSLKEAIGLGYVPLDYTPEGSKFSVDIRGGLRQAVVVKTPFYKR